MLLAYINRGPRRYGEKPVGGARHSGWEFQCVVAGQCWPQIGRRPLDEGKSRRLWVFPKGSMHYWHDHLGGVSEIRVLHAASIPNVLERFMQNRTHWKVELSEQALRFALECYERLFAEFDDQQGLSELTIRRSLIDLCELLLSDAPLQTQAKRGAFADAKVAHAIEWYCQNMSEGPTLNEVAAALHITPTHLRRLFLQVDGRNPKECFREIRMQVAMHLLEQGNLSVGAVAHRLGFSEESSFSRAFRQCFGHSPRRARA